jgi:capsular exopolysaccharide synthesis family protein
MEEGFEAPAQLVVKRLRRHKLLVATIFALGTMASVAFVEMATPRYTAQAVLAVGPSRDMLGSKQDISAEPIAIAKVWTEVTKLQSWTLTNMVVDHLGLDADPEINLSLQKRSLLDLKFTQFKEWVLRHLGELGVPGASRVTQEQSVSALRAEINKEEEDHRVPPSRKVTPERILLIQAFQRHLDVQPDRLSNLINVRFTAGDSQRAAWIVNDLIQTYLAEQVNVKYRATQQEIEWLTSTIARMQTTLSAAENALERFRSQAHLIDDRNGSSLVARQLADITAQNTIAQAGEAIARARAVQVQTVLSKNPAQLATIPEVLGAVQIQQLKMEDTRASQQLVAARANLGADHPTVARLRQQLGDIEAAMATETRRIADGIISAAEAAKARRQGLEMLLAKLQQEAGEVDQSEVHLRELKREVDANRAVYEPFLLKVKDLTAKLEVQQPDASVVAPALPPLSPSFPRKPQLVGLSALGSLLLGLAAAFLVDMHESGFESPLQLERATGVLNLGSLPRVPLISRVTEAGFGRRRNNIIYGEAIQGVRSSLDDGSDTRIRSLMITSALAGEGKSIFAMSLARMAAICGERVVLVDADLINPTVHSQLNVANEIGLIDVLLGNCELKDVVRLDARTSMSYISAGTLLDRPNDLLGSAAMRNLLEELAGSFDRVIIDTSPVLISSGPRRLSRLVDRSIMVVSWRRTPVQTCLAALAQLQRAGAEVSGTVLSMIDLSTYLSSAIGGSRDTLRYVQRSLPHDEA